MTLQNNMPTHLNPIVALFGSGSSIPTQPGTYKCKIQVEKGNVLFRHGAYNVQTGCWDDAPEGADASKIVIHEGETKELEFTCKEHYGQLDEIGIYNNSYFKPADFTCTCQKQ